MAFGDLEFLNTVPDFSQKPEVSDNAMQALTSIGYARKVVQFPADQFTRFVFDYTFLTRQAQRDFLDFFSDRAGRHEAFWIPSWHRDLYVTDGIENASTELTIVNTEFSTGWNPTTENDPGYYIFLRSREYGLVTRQVSGVTATTITLSEALTWTDSKAVVGFIWLVRFDMDELALKAILPGKSSVKCQFKQVLKPET